MSGRRRKGLRAVTGRAGGLSYKDVWAMVRRIPKGKVATYGGVARAAGFPGAARQVAWALRGAPRSLRLPWHRVLGAGGRILLTAEAGLEQRLRLQSEGITFFGNRVQIRRHEYKHEYRIEA